MNIFYFIVDVLDVNQKYEETPIPNGVKRKWDIKYNVSTGRESDCRKTVHLCRRNSTKLNANTKKCEIDEIIQTHQVSSCQFPLKYNDTGYITDMFPFYLQFSPWDAHDRYNPQLFLLTTNTEGQFIGL